MLSLKLHGALPSEPPPCGFTASPSPASQLAAFHVAACEGDRLRLVVDDIVPGDEKLPMPYDAIDLA
jgi:hypothetical protein